LNPLFVAKRKRYVGSLFTLWQFGGFLNLSLVIEFWVNLEIFTLMMILSCWVW